MMTPHAPKSARPLGIGLGLLLALALAAPEAAASSLLQFRLTNESSRPVSQVDFSIVPPGSVVPPIVGTDPSTGHDLTGSPVTVLSGSTGFDPSKFSVALGSGDGVQALRMLFGQTQSVGTDGQVTYTPAIDANGDPVGLFMPGAVLNFALNIDGTDPSAVQLRLPDGATGLALKSFPIDTGTDPGTGNGGNGGSTPPPGGNGNEIPEPMSAALWSVVVGLTVARVRVLRRRRAAAA